MSRRPFAVLIAVASLAVLSGCAGADSSAGPAAWEEPVYTPAPAPVYVEDVYPGGVPLNPGDVVEAGQWAIVDTVARRASAVEETMPVSIQITGVDASPVTDEERTTLTEIESSLAEGNVALLRYTSQLLTEIPDGWVAPGGNVLFDPVRQDGGDEGLTAYTAIGGLDFCTPGMDFSANNGRNVEGAVANGCFIVAWDGDEPPAGLAFVGPSFPGEPSPFAENPVLFLLPGLD